MFLWRQYDRCDHSLELHICGRMNSLWVGRITHPKKRLACETGNRNDWKSEKWEEDFKTDEEGFVNLNCQKDQIRPRKTGPLPSTLLHTNTLTVQTL